MKVVRRQARPRQIHRQIRRCHRTRHHRRCHQTRRCHWVRPQRCLTPLRHHHRRCHCHRTRQARRHCHRRRHPCCRLAPWWRELPVPVGGAVPVGKSVCRGQYTSDGVRTPTPGRVRVTYANTLSLPLWLLPRQRCRWRGAGWPSWRVQRQQVQAESPARLLTQQHRCRRNNTTAATAATTTAASTHKRCLGYWRPPQPPFPPFTALPLAAQPLHSQCTGMNLSFYARVDTNPYFGE